MIANASSLFEPVKIGSLNIPNRLVIPPMCQYSAVDGKATDWHLIHIGQMAVSGAGLFIIEATGVSPEARITTRDLGLWSEETAVALGDVLKRVRNYSCMPIGIQLGHAGRKASSQVPWEGGALLSPDDPDGWLPVAPSSLPYKVGEAAPLELSQEAIFKIIKDFSDAARRAVEIGVELIEIHAAHGYLLHQFLSPISNKRSDEYGGCLENRIRIVLEIYKAIREVVPEGFPIGVRISGTDWVDGGWDIEQSILLSEALEKLGLSYIHVSSGGVSPQQKIPLGPNYQVPLAAAVRAAVSIPVIAVGLITEADQAEAIVANGEADLVALGRGMLDDPRWPWHAAARLGAKIKAPPQYWRSEPSCSSSVFSEAKVGQR